MLRTLQQPPDGLPKFLEVDERPDPKAFELDTGAVMASFGILFIGYALAFAVYSIECLCRK